MGFDQYHEPPEELTEETRTYVRVIQSLIEEDDYVERTPDPPCIHVA